MRDELLEPVPALDRPGLGRIVPNVVRGDELVDDREVAIRPDSVDEAADDLLVRTHGSCASSRPSRATKHEQADADPGQDSEERHPYGGSATS